MIPSVVTIISFYNQRAQTAGTTELQQEQSKLDTQRRIQSQKDRIAQYNARIAEDQEQITEFQSKNDARLNGTIENKKSDIENTKLDIQQAQLEIKKIQEDAQTSATKSTSWSTLSPILYSLAASSVNVLVYVVSLIFLTRKKVKALFH